MENKWNGEKQVGSGHTSFTQVVFCTPRIWEEHQRKGGCAGPPRWLADKASRRQPGGEVSRWQRMQGRTVPSAQEKTDCMRLCTSHWRPYLDGQLARQGMVLTDMKTEVEATGRQECALPRVS